MVQSRVWEISVLAEWVRTVIDHIENFQQNFTVFPSNADVRTSCEHKRHYSMIVISSKKSYFGHPTLIWAANLSVSILSCIQLPCERRRGLMLMSASTMPQGLYSPPLFHMESTWNMPHSIWIPSLHMEYVLAESPLILGSPFHLDSTWNGDGMMECPYGFHMESL